MTLSVILVLYGVGVVLSIATVLMLRGLSTLTYGDLFDAIFYSLFWPAVYPTALVITLADEARDRFRRLFGTPVRG